MIFDIFGSDHYNLLKRCQEWDQWGMWTTIGDNLYPYNVDIIQRNNFLEYNIAVPGRNKNDVEIFIKKDLIEIHIGKYGEGAEYKQNEIPKKEYMLSIPIASEYDSSTIKSSMKDGLLKITIAKTSDLAAKKVEITD